MDTKIRLKKLGCKNIVKKFGIEKLFIVLPDKLSSRFLAGGNRVTVIIDKIAAKTLVKVNTNIIVKNNLPVFLKVGMRAIEWVILKKINGATDNKINFKNISPTGFNSIASGQSTPAMPPHIMAKIKIIAKK